MFLKSYFKMSMVKSGVFTNQLLSFIILFFENCQSHSKLRYRSQPPDDARRTLSVDL